ncbi:MAG: tetratricopeptide repeat protein [Acidobacteria bacterium]|nr:tetratricopeptide repeat protein [Acidobacteriota bacterium]
MDRRRRGAVRWGVDSAKGSRVSEFSRKQLKHDQFVEEVGHAYGFYATHKQPILIGGAVLLALIVGLTSYFGYSERREAEAGKALDEAVKLYYGTVTTEQRVGYVTFTTSGERYRRTTEALEKVETDFSGTETAAAADYYLALLEIEQQMHDEAAKRLEGVIGKADESYSSLARLTLANLLAQQGEMDKAKPYYQALIDHPTPVVPASRAKLEMARAMVKSDPAGARTLLEELMAEPGPVGAAAGVALRSIPGA